MRVFVSRSALLLLVALAGGAAPALAHHSFSMFDQAAPITITGVVSSVEWTNPHVYIELDLTEPVKGAKHWSIELGSPSILQRGGWKFNSVKKAVRAKLDTDLDEAALREVVSRYKVVARKLSGRAFPQDPRTQLTMARDAVFRSWISTWCPIAIRRRGSACSWPSATRG